MISVATLVAESGVEDDGTLADLIQRATEFVQTQTRRYFGPPAPEVFYLIGHGTYNLWLPEPPTNIDDEPDRVEERQYPGDTPNVIYRGDSATDIAFTVRPAATRAVAVRGERSVWNKGWEYAWAYQRGYAVDTGPGDVRQLVLDLASHKLALRTSGESLLKSETIDNYSYTRFDSTDLDAIGAGAWATIEAWRVPVFA